MAIDFHDDDADHKCWQCKKEFASKHARDQHCRDTKCQGSDSVADRKARVELLDDLWGDEGDGMYYAMMFEMGLDTDDLLEFAKHDHDDDGDHDAPYVDDPWREDEDAHA